MGKLYPRHEKQTKNPAETTGNRYEIEILMSRTQIMEHFAIAIVESTQANDHIANFDKVLQAANTNIPVYLLPIADLKDIYNQLYLNGPKCCTCGVHSFKL